MADVLTAEQLAEELQTLPGWSGDTETGVSKTYKVHGFTGSVALINDLAERAEAVDHHPDLAVAYNQVTVTFLTHSVGNTTSADVAEARYVEEQIAPKHAR